MYGIVVVVESKLILRAADLRQIFPFSSQHLPPIFQGFSSASDLWIITTSKGSSGLLLYLPGKYPSSLRPSKFRHLIEIIVSTEDVLFSGFGAGSIILVSHVFLLILGFAWFKKLVFS